MSFTALISSYETSKFYVAVQFISVAVPMRSVQTKARTNLNEIKF